jgi:hypothetical protein
MSAVASHRHEAPMDGSHDTGMSPESDMMSNDGTIDDPSLTGEKRTADDMLGDDLGDDDDPIRSENLHRNRLAATKCRLKKKVWIEELERKTGEASRRHDQLQASIVQLKDELASLRNMLLAHRNCNCNLIQKVRLV